MDRQWRPARSAQKSILGRMGQDPQTRPMSADAVAGGSRGACVGSRPLAFSSFSKPFTFLGHRPSIRKRVIHRTAKCRRGRNRLRLCVKSFHSIAGFSFDDRICRGLSRKVRFGGTPKPALGTSTPPGSPPASRLLQQRPHRGEAIFHGILLHRRVQDLCRAAPLDPVGRKFLDE